MLASGQSRSLRSSLAWKAIKVSWSRTQLRITPSLQNSPPRLTTRERLWSYNMKSNHRVSARIAFIEDSKSLTLPQMASNVVAHT